MSTAERIGATAEAAPVSFPAPAAGADGGTPIRPAPAKPPLEETDRSGEPVGSGTKSL